MAREMIAQASEFLLVYLTTPSADDAPDRLSAIFNLIYQERLNREPVDLSNPAVAVQAACDRLGNIILDHVALEAALLAIASSATGRSPEAILHNIAGQMAEEEEHPRRPPEP
ncbi:MAG TPA: hypothetical protein VE733_27325 [Streptosporangiaceae bacterium]|jgi:hypothetical protein|nr:hypothetical protein [Streptosporangiaceae bacterium]